MEMYMIELDSTKEINLQLWKFNFLDNISRNYKCIAIEWWLFACDSV